MEQTEQALGRWIVPLTEVELAAWISCPRYGLPRSGVSVAAPADMGKVMLGETSEEKDDWLLAVYRAKTDRPREGVPFSDVLELLGMTDRKLALIENHHEGFGPEIKAASPDQRAAFDVCWRQSRIETLAADCERGANGLAAMTGLRRKVGRKYGRCIAELLVADELGETPESVPASLLTYSRSSEWKMSPLGAAFCDLGWILRTHLAEDKNQVVTELAKRIGGLFGSGAEVPPTAIVKLARDFKRLEDFKLYYVLFLKWKYAGERHGGAIDFNEVMGDVAWFGTTAALKLELEKALFLYGAFVGFKAFAVQYHLRMREGDHG